MLLSMDEKPKILTTAEVAAIFRVDAKTVGRWVAEGRLSAIRTPGGQYRFARHEIEQMLRRSTTGGTS
jgi:excisionase family DNA binding protein